jgi:hypothetical protein
MLWAYQQGQLLGISLFWDVGEGTSVNLHSADNVLRRFRAVGRLHSFWIQPENQAQANWEWIVAAAEADPNNRLHGQSFSKYDYYRAVRRIGRERNPLGLPSL